MGLTNYVSENDGMIYELVGLLALLGIGVHLTERTKKLTLAVVVLLVLESAAFHLERWTQTLNRVVLLRPMLTAFVYSIYPIILLVVMQIIASQELTRRRLLLLLIPEFVSVPLYFTSQWTHLVCWFSKPNNYSGGPLATWPYGIFVFYTLVFLLYNLRYFRNYALKERGVLAVIVLGPMLGVLYCKIFGSEQDYSDLFSSALLLYYIYLYVHQAKTDPLTALLNRQSCYQDQKLRGRAITAVASVDMNELKYLNDSFGHEAGDAALQTVARILEKHCGPTGRVYRVGGDEFTIFYTGAGEAEVAEAVEGMRRAMEATPYSCAFGYAVKGPADSVADAVRASDHRLYEDKAAMKRAIREQGGVLHDRHGDD